MATSPAEAARTIRNLRNPAAGDWVLAVVPAALIAIGIWLRLYRIDQQSLWIDEGISLYFTNCPSFGACFDFMMGAETSERFNFLYFLLLHEWRALFGSSEIAMRGLSLLFGAATLPLVWLAARRLFDAQHALWSLLFVATSAFGVFYAQEVRPYALFLFAGAAQLWLFAETRHTDASMPLKLAFYLTTAVASWISIFSLIFSVALALGDFAAAPRFKRWFLWWLPVGLLCLPAAFYYLFTAFAVPPESVVTQKNDSPLLNLLFVLYGHLVGQSYGPPLEDLHRPDRMAILVGYWPQLGLLLLVGAAALLRAAWLVAHRRFLPPNAWAAKMVLFTTVAFLLMCLAVAVVSKLALLPRHAFALHLLFALALPLLVGGAPTTRNASRRPWTAALMLAICAFNLMALFNYYFRPEHWRDDYRGIARYLVEQQAQGRATILLAGVPVLLRYYGDEKTVDGGAFEPQDLAADVTKAAGGRPDVLLVVNREYYYAPAARLDELLRPTYRLTGKTAFPNFTIYAFARR